MIKIYTGIDIGYYHIKSVVFEVIDNNYHVIGTSCVKTKGIKNGVITDYNLLTETIKLGLNNLENELNLKINKVVLSIPNIDTEYKVISKVIEEEFETITGADVTRIIKSVVKNQETEGKEIVTLMPIEFKVDDIIGIKNPLGMSGNSLGVKAMMITQPKKNVLTLVSIFSSLNIEVIDIVLSSVGDYNEFKNALTENVLGAVVNIGMYKTEVSIFSSGIPIASANIKIGSVNVDYDIAYINNLSMVGGRKLKEDFALATTNNASIKETISVKNKDNEVISVNQLQISEVAASRFEEIINLVKQKINVLTNKPVSYIIFTGGITEMAGFRHLCHEEFGSKCIVGNMKTIGIRHNKYSTVSGIVKYFNEKMLLREKEYTMFDEEKVEDLITSKKTFSLGNTNIINKVVDYFTITKED